MRVNFTVAKEVFRMVPTPNDLGYVAHVYSAGYRWFSLKELGVNSEPSEAFVEGPLLAGVATGDVEPETVTRHPGGRPALFREFAALNPRDLDALAAFANTHGPLGTWRATVRCKRPELARGLPAEVEMLRYHPQEAYLIRLEPDQLRVESHPWWGKTIVRLRTAVAVLDAIRGRDTRRLRELFFWVPRAASGMPTGAWYIDTHRELARGKGGPERVSELVYGEHVGSEFDDVFAVALTYLVQNVNHELDGRVSPMLVIEAGGRVVERLAPLRLHEVLWSQLYSAISEGKEYKRCPACRQEFDVGGRGGATVRKVYCSDACRVRACQARRERAEQLAGEGLKPPAIVARMKGEGHETDVVAVKKWVKAAAKRKPK